MSAVFETARLRIERPTGTDAEAAFLHGLWTDGRVMQNVGFPGGLRVTAEEVGRRLRAADDSEFDRPLLIVSKERGGPVGECMLGTPADEGVAETDVKLSPDSWGRGLGVETKRGLLRCLFAWTGCRAVRATPNVGNAASIRMQEAVGGERIGEGVFTFPEAMAAGTRPVRHLVYLVTRDAWSERHALPAGGGLRLRPVTSDDVDAALPWYQDERVYGPMDGPGAAPYDRGMIVEMYRALTRIGECYIIELREGERWTPIGDATLADETVPIAIGRPDLWGRGIGRAVLDALIARARAAGLRRLATKGILESNVRSLRLYRAAGFRERGTGPLGVRMDMEL